MARLETWAVIKKREKITMLMLARLQVGDMIPFGGGNFFATLDVPTSKFLNETYTWTKCRKQSGRRVIRTSILSAYLGALPDMGSTHLADLIAAR